MSDFVKVVDFGLVKDVGFRSSDGMQPVGALTEENIVTGTPLYMSPEALTTPESVDARADIYALGAVGYWLLTGTHVFNGRSVVDVAAYHLHSAPDPPSARLGAPVSSDLETLLLDCLAKRPADRPASAHVLRDRLLACAAAGRWTRANGAQWWTEHFQELRARTAHEKASPDTLGATLTVDRVA
jgi:serine/threonine-protein kinase